MILRDQQGTHYGRVHGGADGQDMGLMDSDGDYFIHSRLNSYLRLMVNGTERLRILNNGNVGIGTGAPTERLHVAGGARIDGHIQSGSRVIRDGGGGWVRSYGDTGWYNETHGGGWYMTDGTWLRAYNDKSVLTAGQVRGGELYATGNGNVNNLYIRSIGKWASQIGTPRSCAWVGTGQDALHADDRWHSAECPAGKWVAGWRCFASEYLDSQCAIKCCGL
ncbi:shufflon system plasmid conjugative transfer pilus tip adhesin PilV [Amorphus sp. 3PC139-8]